MLRDLKSLFEQRIAPALSARDSEPQEHAYRLAAGALLFEVSRADDQISEPELERIAATLRQSFGLNAEETAHLLESARTRAEASVSLHEFTSLINERLSPEEKFQLVKRLWQVAYVDGVLDKHEEYVVRKVSDLIHVPHPQFMRAKHEAHG